MSSRQPRQLDCLQTNKQSQQERITSSSELPKIPSNPQLEKNWGHPYLSRRKQNGSHTLISTESHLQFQSRDFRAEIPNFGFLTPFIARQSLFRRARDSGLLSVIHNWNIYDKIVRRLSYLQDTVFRIAVTEVTINLFCSFLLICAHHNLLSPWLTKKGGNQFQASFQL